MNLYGRAKVNARHPQAFAVCDRCGIWYNHADLNPQYEWRGSSLQNTGYLVCRTCLDVPQEQFRPISLPPDPPPVANPRPEFFIYAETGFRATDAGNLRITDADNYRVVDMDDGPPIPVEGE